VQQIRDVKYTIYLVHSVEVCERLLLRYVTLLVGRS